MRVDVHEEESLTTTPQKLDIYEAALCELLALSLRHPAMQLANALSSGEWQGACKEIAHKTDLALPTKFNTELGKLASYHACNPEDILHELGIEATRLFVPTPEMQVAPYEGIWRANKEHVKPLMFVNPHSIEVERFCRNCGLAKPANHNDPLDHVATEFELLQYLASIESGITTPANYSTQPSDFPGGSAQAAYQIFLSEHAAIWMPDFGNALIKESNLGFYKIVGCMVHAFASK